MKKTAFNINVVPFRKLCASLSDNDYNGFSSDSDGVYFTNSYMLLHWPGMTPAQFLDLTGIDLDRERRSSADLGKMARQMAAYTYEYASKTPFTAKRKAMGRKCGTVQAFTNCTRAAWYDTTFLDVIAWNSADLSTGKTPVLRLCGVFVDAYILPVVAPEYNCILDAIRANYAKEV